MSSNSNTSGRGKANKVLIVEDSTDVREMLETSFTSAGFEVETAADGVEAMARYWTAMAKGEPFGVAVLDVALPLLDGFEIAKRIKSAERDARIPRPCRLIGYTGYGEHAEGMMKFEESGFDRLITKSDGDTELPALAKVLLEEMG